MMRMYMVNGTLHVSDGGSCVYENGIWMKCIQVDARSMINTRALNSQILHHVRVSTA